MSSLVIFIYLLKIERIFDRRKEIALFAKTYRSEKTTSWRLINTQQESDKGDNIILDEGLIEKCVEHRCTEHRPSSEGQTEHIGDVGSTFLFSLQQEMTESILKSHK